MKVYDKEITFNEEYHFINYKNKKKITKDYYGMCNRGE